MPQWRRIYVSGSAAEFSTLTVDGSLVVGSITGSFDGPHFCIRGTNHFSSGSLQGGELTTVSNIAIGTNVLSGSAGSDNTGIGHLVLNENTTGCRNTGIGYQALCGSTTGIGNISIGYLSLKNNTTGNCNVVIGYNALQSASLSSINVAIGTCAGYTITGSSTNNLFIGSNVGPTTACSASNTIWIDTAATNTPLIYGCTTAADRRVTINTKLTSTEITGSTLLVNSTSSFLGKAIFEATSSFLGEAVFGTTSDAFKDIFIQSSTTGESAVSFGDIDDNIGRIGYSNAQNYMYFRVNDSERLRITASGDVFVCHNLQVSQSITGSCIFVVKESDIENTNLALHAGASPSTARCAVIQMREWDQNASYARGFDLIYDGDGTGRFCGASVVCASQNNVTTSFQIDRNSSNITINHDLSVLGSTTLLQTQVTAITASSTLSSTVPFYTFDGDLDTGIGRIGANCLSLITNGIEGLRLNSLGSVFLPTGGLTVGGRWLVVDAPITASSATSATNPLYTFTGDLNTGIGRQAADTLTFITNGASRFNIDSQGTSSFSGRVYQDSIGTENTAFGQCALENNTTGTANTAFGCCAAINTTTRSSNTAIGANALSGTTPGSGNTAIGANTLTQMIATTAASNTAVGQCALYCVTRGCRNIGVGVQAGRLITVGSLNTIVGVFSGQCLESGSDNTIIGYSSGDRLANSDCNTILGSRNGNAVLETTSGSNQILVGVSTEASPVSADNHTVWGNASNNVCNCVFSAWQNVSDCNDKTDIQNLNPSLGLSFVEKLRPISYYWDHRDAYVDKCGFEYGNKDGTLKSEKQHYGLMAQDVKETLCNLKIRFDALGYDSTKNAYRMAYEEIIPSLILSIQQLNSKIERLEECINR